MILMALGCLLKSPVSVQILFPGHARGYWLAMRLAAWLCMCRAVAEVML